MPLSIDLKARKKDVYKLLRAVFMVIFDRLVAWNAQDELAPAALLDHGVNEMYRCVNLHSLLLPVERNRRWRVKSSIFQQLLPCFVVCSHQTLFFLISFLGFETF